MNERRFDPANAHRLEDPQRLVWTPPGEIAEKLGLAGGMAVADIGAGTGFFALPFARVVGVRGTVWAVDVQAAMLQLLAQKLQREGVTDNVRPVHGDAERTGLPDCSIDIAFLGNLWHELTDHRAVLAEMQRVLRPGGRIAILDWRPGVTQPPGPPLDHRISLREIQATLEQHGWDLISSSEMGPYSQFVLAAPRP